MLQNRLIQIWWDIVDNVHRDANGQEINKNVFPFIMYRERPIVNLQIVVDSSLTKYDELAAGLVFTASLDNDYDHSSSSPLMAKTASSGINQAGDWLASSNLQADYQDGEFSIQLNADNPNYQSKIGVSEEQQNGIFEVLGFNNLGYVVFILQMPFRLFNIVDDNGATPEEVVEASFIREYVDIASGKKCLRFVNSDEETLEIMCPPGV